MNLSPHCRLTIFTFLLCSLFASAFTVDLLPYGVPLDIDLHCNDCTSGNVIPDGKAIVFFGETYTEMFVSSNGELILGCSESSFTRQSPQIAPFFSDIDTELVNNAIIDGTVYYRTVVGSDVSFDTFINDNFGINFNTIYEVIVTYDNVRYHTQGTPERNTFQAEVVVSAYGETAVCFNYPENGLNWPSSSYPSNLGYPIAGFYSGPDLNLAYYLPGSGTIDVANLDNIVGNTGDLGNFCYIVSGLEVLDSCAITTLLCREPAFYPVNTALTLNDVVAGYSFCPSQTIHYSPSSFTCNDIGLLVPVTVTIGSLSCTSYFVPTASQLAYQNCPADIVVYSSTPTTVHWIPPTATGDCLSPTHQYANYYPDQSYFPLGITTVSYHAYDVSYNNRIYCSFQITVLPQVIVTYHVIDVFNNPIPAAAIGGSLSDCSYTDPYGFCSVIAPNVFVGDIIQAGFFYVNFNGNIYAIPHSDIAVTCYDLHITIIISPPGFYRTEGGDIIGCQPGTYSDTYEATQCIDCTAGTFNPDNYATSCEECPTGYYSAIESTSCFTCSAGYYLDTYLGQCSICPAGTYSCDRAIECLDCPYGSFSFAGSSSCSYCDAGYYFDIYQQRCIACAAGSYSFERSTYCLPCPTGSWSNEASNECFACIAGFFLNITSEHCEACPGGTISCDRATECTPCAIGGFAAPGSSQCTFCSAGYYYDGMMEGDDLPCGCKACPAGTYSCDRATSCAPCPVGGWSMPGSSTCYFCYSGYYLDEASGNCLVCPGNTYSPDYATDCTACPDGSYSLPGSSFCSFCSPGYYFNEFTGYCDLCPAGTFSSSRASECTPCPEGSYSFIGSTTCLFCDAGYYLDASSSSCQPCPANTFSCDRAELCEFCPTGSYSYPGSSSCLFCDAGYYLDPFSFTCVPCAAGFFSSDRAIECSACPVGYWSLPGSASCYSCTAGFYLDVNLGSCVACPLGYTSDDRAISCTLIPVSPPVNEQLGCNAGSYLEAATNSCLPCPPNSFSASGATSCTPCPYGSYSPIASTSCTFCSAGSYLDVNLFNCYPCPSNTFSPDRATECYPCPFGSVSSVGSGWCTPCPNGTVVSPSTGSCALCPSNSFVYNGVCVPCDVTSFCPFCPPGYEADIICSECCAGFYSPDGNNCLQCPPGSYSGGGAASCVTCAPGTTWSERFSCCV